MNYLLSPKSPRLQEAFLQLGGKQHEKYGYDAVISALGKLKNETGFNIYNYKEKEIWDKYLAKENN